MNIKPFKLDIPQSEVDDLRLRLKRTRWPQEVSGQDWLRGVPLNHAKKMASYWADHYDWRAQESALNTMRQFTAEVDGQTIHFVHVRSAEAKAKPLLLIHGYPGSFVDFARMIEPLTNPVAHGGRPEDAFHVVVPSLPGFGFSTPVTTEGWEIGRSAKALDAIMQELGYESYGLHGSDIGAGVCEELCILGGERITGSLIATDPGAIATDYTPPTDHLNEDEKDHLKELKAARAEDFGYISIQSTRPQTLAYALTDSPVGQLAWIVEKFKAWTDPSKTKLEDAVDLDQLLTNVSVYWFGGGGAGAANFIYEAHHTHAAWGRSHSVVQGFVVFGKEPLVRRILDPQGKLAHWTEYGEGGHFPAMEVPELLVKDLRKFFASL